MDPSSAEFLSCASNDSRTRSTFTPPSISTDVDNINIDGRGNMKVLDGRPRRSSRMNTYNETVLSGSWVRRKCGKAENRTIPGETLVEGLKLANADSTGPMNEDQYVGVSVVAETEATADGDAGSATRTRRWTRAGVLANASDVLERTKSILGKRKRDPGEIEKESGEALKADSRNCLDQGSNVGPSSEGPTRKKARFANTTGLEKVSSLPKSDQRVSKQVKTKYWLKQGLYVGQDRDFNPKLTETKNKLKKNYPTTEVRGSKSSILPFPMFAGQRSLELGRTFRLPFDVFSPLPPGQPRPDEWRKTRTSMDLGIRFDLTPLTAILQMCSLARLPTCGKSPSVSSHQPVYVRLRAVARKIASIVSCSTNVTIRTARWGLNTVVIVALRVYGSGT